MHVFWAFRPFWLETSISICSFWGVDTCFWINFSCLAKSGCLNLKLAGNIFSPFPSFRSPAGNLGTWELENLGTWELGNLGTWKLGNLGTWELGNLGTWELRKLGIWNFGTWELENLETWELGKLETWKLGILGSWDLGNFGTLELGNSQPLQTR